MHVSVAIVSYRNCYDVRACLEALAGSEHRDFEVIVWENGGEAAYAELLATLPPALPGGQVIRPYLSPGNIGFAGGVNACLRATPDADAWWVLNPDTMPESLALAGLTARLERGDCDAVGCLVYFPDGQVQSYGGRWERLVARAVSIGHGSARGVPKDAREVELHQNYLNGACMLVGRRFVELAGLMREDYFLYCEEVEWCLRGLASGARLGFASGAAVLHKQGTTTGYAAHAAKRSRLSVYLSERNRILLTRDAFPQLIVTAAVGGLAILLLRYVRSAAWPQLGYAILGWAAGLVNQRGAPRWFEAEQRSVNPV